MNVEKILADLRQEQKQVAEAIASLERLASQGPKRRGRPPAWLANAKPEGEAPPVKAKRGRKPKVRTS